MSHPLPTLSTWLALTLAGCAVDSPSEAPTPPQGEPISDDDSTVADDNWGDDDWGDDDTVVGDDDDASGDDDGANPDDGDEEASETCDDAFEAPQTRFLSADDSNSMAEPSYVRQSLLEAGRVPETAKPWEFLNEADWDFAPAEPGHVRIEPVLVETRADPQTYGMLIAVVAPSVEPGDREPLNLVFTVDTSSSMSGAGLPRAKDAMRTIANGLLPGDVVSIVKWASASAVELDALSVIGPADPTLLDTIDALTTNGNTNLEGGLAAAYQQIDANTEPGRADRVILISDGGANLGSTSAALIADRSIDAEREGTYLLGIGVPPVTSYRHTLMDEITDLGRGAYLYVGTEDDAENLLAPSRLPSLLQIAAREVQLGVTLPAGFVVDHFAGEDFGTTPTAVIPQHLAMNDQMLYALDLLDCSADPDSLGLTFTFTAEWVDPVWGTSQVDSLTMTVADLLFASPRNWLKADALVAFAESFAAVRSMSPAAAEDHLESVRTQVEAAAALFPADEDLAELLLELDAWMALL